MQALRQFVYASSATRLLREPELLDIVDSARARNVASQTTGMLLYAEGSFIQVLEGDAGVLEKLIRKPKRDIRHRGLLTLLDRVTTERDFDGSSLAFQHVSPQELDRLAGFYDWSAAMPTRRKTAVALCLLEAFRLSLVPQS